MFCQLSDTPAAQSTCEASWLRLGKVMAQFTSDGLTLAYDEFGPSDAAQGDGAGPWLLVQSLRELEAHGLVRRHRRQGPARLRARLPRPWRERQAARTRQVRPPGDGARCVCPHGPCRRRARAPAGLLHGRAYRPRRCNDRRRAHRPSGRGRCRRPHLRALARSRGHGQGDGGGLARRDRRSHDEKLPALRRRAEGRPAGARRLLARPARADHAQTR